MFKPRSLLLVFVVLLSFTWLLSSGLWKRTKTRWAADKPRSQQLGDPSLKKLQSKAADARLFAQQKGYNEAIYLLVDMSLSSGQNRFFVYDLNKDTVRNAGLVTHGRCNQNWLEGRKIR